MRFQECSPLHKAWRFRYYIPIPFKFIYHIVKPIKVIDDDTDIIEELTFYETWSLLIGEAQVKMKWYYTLDEIMKDGEIQKG